MARVGAHTHTHTHAHTTHARAHTHTHTPQVQLGQLMHHSSRYARRAAIVL